MHLTVVPVGIRDNAAKLAAGTVRMGDGAVFGLVGVAVTVVAAVEDRALEGDVGGIRNFAMGAGADGGGRWGGCRCGRVLRLNKTSA